MHAIYYTTSNNNPKLIGRYKRNDNRHSTDETANQQQLPLHGSYGNLLFDPRWKSRRSEIVNRDNGRCVICNHTGDLQVHHRQYHFIRSANAFKMPWDYADHLMITLCKSCHQRGHSKFKVPTITL